jgi:Flp pilus assembly protein TadG
MTADPCRRAPSPTAVGRSRDDRGSATTELVLIMPVLIGFLFLVVAAGRLTDAKSDVVSAASDAARAASLQTDGGAAAAQAQAIAEDSVAGEGIECIGGIDVSLSYSGGSGGFGPGATVQATVTCDVETGDLALLNLPGVVTVTEHAWEPIDAHRSR